jgi:exosortase
MSIDATTSGQDGARSAAAISLSRPVIIACAAVVILLYGILFEDFLAQQWRFAIALPSDWGHTLIIPFVSAYFVWLNRKELTALQPFVPSWWGLVPISLGVGWYSLCVFGPKPLFHHNVMSVGILLTVAGSAWLLFGSAAMRWLTFPILYWWVFGQTLSEVVMNRVTFQLQDISAIGAQFLLTAVGNDVDRSGNTLVVWSDGVPHPLNVAEACSGMRMLVAFLALGVFLARTNLTGVWSRVILTLAGLPVALGVNVLRIATTGVFAMFDQNFADGEFHELIGFVWLLPGLFIYMGVLWIVRNFFVRATGAGDAV